MSPFEIFRRNLKPMMVFLTALALFAFVALPAMDTYLRRGGGTGTDAQIAVFDGVPVTQNRVEYLTRNHRSTINFLRELAQETIRRGGSPRTPGFVYDTQSGQIRSVGIDENPSFLGTVRTLQFASEANKAGFELDDTAIKSWLNQFTDGTMTDSEIVSLLMNNTRNQMGRFHLYEQLRNQLLAGLYQRGALAAVPLIAGQFPIMTPAEQWANFLKVNQQATIDSYGVLVNDYIDQTNSSPSEAEIEAVYKEGIERFPSEKSPEPGFRKRKTATFEYLVADMKAFMDREIEKISEETLKAEYERRLKGGDFQLPDLPDLSSEEATGTKPDEEKSDEPEKTGAEKTSTEKTDADKTGADADGDESTGAQKEMKQAESTESKQADPAKQAEPDSSQEDETAKNREQVDAFKKEIDAVREEAKQDQTSADDQSVNQLPGAVRLVAYQQDEATADSQDQAEATKDESSEERKGTETAEDVPQEDTPADQSEPAEDPANEQPKEEAKPEQPKADEAKPDEAKPEEAKPEEAKPEEAKSAGDEAKPAEEAESKESKLETFEDVRDQIAQSLAEPTALKKIDAAVTEVTETMRRYFNENAIYESDILIGKKSEPPTKPDLFALAEKLGMEFQALPPHNVVSISDEPISQSAEGSQMGRRGPSFVDMMYGAQGMAEKPLFSPLLTTDSVERRFYVSWKVAEQEGYVPDLEEVRSDVIETIRVREARGLARAAAEKIAEQVNTGEAFADLIPEDKKANFKQSLGPFSWMNSFGFQGAFLGNVPELDLVGDDFMRTVFSTEAGKAAVAANDPQRVFYVVQPNEFQPHVDDLKGIFKQPQQRMMALPLGSNDVRAIMGGFYEAVDERTGFTFADEEQLR